MVEPTQSISPPNSLYSPHASNDKRKRIDDLDYESSSIQKMATPIPAYTPSKPVLDPIQNVMHNYINKVEPMANRWSVYREKEIEKEFAHIDQLHHEEAKQLEEATQASQQVSFWGILGDVSSSITSAISFFFGFSAISAGSPAVGGVLIVSGVLSLSNLAFKHGQVWDFVADHVAGNDKELKQTILTYIPPAVGITASLIGIYGSYTAFNYSAQTGLARATSLLESTTTIASAVAGISSGVANYHLKNALASLNFLQSNRELSTLSLENYADDVKEFHEKQTRIHEIIGRIIEETDQAIQVIHQPV